METRFTDNRPRKAGWRINEFGAATGLCRSSVYNILDQLRTVKIGNARVILTDPREYLESIAREQGV
jgi:hypothetical protein